MMNEEQIIKRINQVWKELTRERTIERLGIKTTQIKQLFEVLEVKELIISKLPEPSEPVTKAEVSKAIKEEVKKLQNFKD